MELAQHPFTLDGHQDAYYYAHNWGGCAQFDAGWPAAQLDLPGLRAAEVDAAFWAIFAPSEQHMRYDPLQASQEVDGQLAAYRLWMTQTSTYRTITSQADLRAVAAASAVPSTSPPFGVVLHCEGARGIRDGDHLQYLYTAGLRSVGLTWNGANRYATGSGGDPRAGLTPAGKDLVRALNQLHMVIDAAHLNRQGVWDLLEISTAPVLVTHTACGTLVPHPRNLEDDQIKAVAAGGGLIGVFYANMFLAPKGTSVTINTVRAHYDHLLDLVGPEHIALGSDYGGLEHDEVPTDLSAIRSLPHLFTELLQAGYSPATVAALRGQNYLRVLQTILE